MKLLLAGLVPVLLGSGMALNATPPEPALRNAMLVSSQRLPCLYARLAAERGEDTRARLSECASQWRDERAAQTLANLPDVLGSEPEL